MAFLNDRRLSRRDVIRMAGLAAVGAAGARWEMAEALSQVTASPSAPPTADEALGLLMEGNSRWVAAQLDRPNQSADRRTLVAAGQQPFAIVFSCIDSRVPPELVFDRGLGDLFVVRTAGHVLDDAAMGSIEYGVAVVGVPLLVVLGHERCGAVVDSIEIVEHDEAAPGHINALVEGIRPAIAMAHDEPGDATDNVVRAHTQLVVAALKASEPILGPSVAAGRLTVVGGHYDLRSGAIELIA